MTLGLNPEGSFKAAEVRFVSADQIQKSDLKRWLMKSKKHNRIIKIFGNEREVIERLK